MHVVDNVPNEWENTLTEFLKNNDIEQASLLINNDVTGSCISDIHLAKLFFYFCRHNKLETVKLLLNGDVINRHAPIDDQRFKEALITAVGQNQLDIVEFVVEHLISEKKIDFKDNSVSFFLNLHDTNISVLKYFLTKPEISHRIIQNIPFILKRACRNNFDNLLNYLVFDYKIAENDQVISLASQSEYTKLKDLFDKRRLHENLTQKLNEFEYTSKVMHCKTGFKI